MTTHLWHCLCCGCLWTLPLTPHTSNVNSEWCRIKSGNVNFFFLIQVEVWVGIVYFQNKSIKISGISEDYDISTYEWWFPINIFASPSFISTVGSVIVIFFRKKLGRAIILWLFLRCLIIKLGVTFWKYSNSKAIVYVNYVFLQTIIVSVIGLGT